MNKKYTIFVSSTYEDLKDERQDVVRTTLEMGHFPIGMEMFSAGNETQWEVIRRTIDQSDYYVLIVAARYGSTIPAEGGISYTEKEYDYAVSKGVPVMAFVLSEGAAWPSTKREKNRAAAKRLEQFKSKVSSRMVSFWNSREQLSTNFAVALGKTIAQFERPGWVPSSAAATPETSNEIARLSRDNATLRERLSAIDPSRAEEARLIAIEESLKGIKAATQFGRLTLLEFFLKLPPESNVARLIDYFAHPDAVPISCDLRALVSWGLITESAPATRVPQWPAIQSVFRMTPLGSSLLAYRHRLAMTKTGSTLQ
ncbi:MAG TPA: DUF4062 domain-containing protein [Phycisphaerales bacterium]